MTPVATQIKPAAIFVTSSKGGPGKSVFACALVDYYRSREIPTAAYDADAKNETLLQFYGQRDLDGTLLEDERQDPQKGVHVFNIRDANQRDVLLEVTEHRSTRVIIDLPGGGAEDVAAVLNSTDAFFGAFVDAGIDPIVVIMISNSKSSAAAVGATIDLFGKTPHYIVVRNRHFGDEFPAFDGIVENGAERFMGARRALSSVNGQVMNFPALSNETWGRWDLASCTLAQAALIPQSNNGNGHAPGADKLKLGDKHRLALWRSSFAEEVAGTRLAL